MRTRLLFSLLMGLSCFPAFAAEPGDPSALAISPQVNKRAGELIVILGGKDADKRNEAYMELDKLGRQALPAIEASLKGKLDAELKTNLDRLRGPAMKEQFQASYKIFLADKDNKYDHDFPGWTQLKAAAKDNKDSRKLMRDILTDENRVGIIEMACTTQAEAVKALNEKSGRIQSQHFQYDSAKTTTLTIHYFILEIATLLVAHSTVIEERYDNTNRKVRYGGGLGIGFNFLAAVGHKSKDEKNFISELSGKSHYGKTLHNLCTYWVDTRVAEGSLYTAEQLCIHFELGEDRIRSCMTRVLQCKKGTVYILTRMSILAQTGKSEYLELFKIHLDDVHPSSCYIRPLDVQLRDHALLYCILLTKQDPAGYGYSYAFAGKERTTNKPEDIEFNQYMKHLYNNYGFESDDKGSVMEKRKKAFAKWTEWESKKSK